MESRQFSTDFDYSSMVTQQYEYFQHMVDTIKLHPSAVSELPIEETSIPDVVTQSPSSPAALVNQNLVPGSDGKWAYYVLNGIYLEYPASYSLDVSDTSITFLPFLNVPELWDPLPIFIYVDHIPASVIDATPPRDEYPQDRIVWERVIETSEFEGIELVLNLPSKPDMEFQAFQYNRENQLAVGISMSAKPNFPEGFDYFEMLNQRYEYFQHMVDSIRLQMP
jgi:hypothetical protein